MAHTTVKISELQSANSADITPNSDVLPIVDGDTTKKITVEELFKAPTNISASGTGSFGRIEVLHISSSTGDFDANTIRIGGTALSKSDLDNLKEGKSILSSGNSLTKSRKSRTGTDTTDTFNNISKVNALINTADSNTFIKSDTSKELEFIANNTASIIIDGLRNKNEIGNATGDGAGWTNFYYGKNQFIQTSGGGGEVIFGRGIAGIQHAITGSVPISGSQSVTGSSSTTGSFNVDGDTSLTGSLLLTGSAILSGTIDLSGATTIGDVLTILEGFNATGSNTVSGSLTVSASGNAPAFNVTGSTDLTGSLLLNGPAIVSGTLDLSGATTIGDVLTVLEGFNATGSSTVTGSLTNSGSFTSEGTSSFTGSFASTGQFLVNTGNTPVEFTGSGFNVNNLLSLLANFGEGGIPTGSGQGGVAEGDINLDGQVNVNDIMLVLAGMGNPNVIANNTTLPINVNHQFIGPQISIQANVTLTIPTGSFLQIT